MSEDEPLHARAKKMISKDNNLDIRYEGDAVLWQGADRLEAETVEIDRDNNLLKAHGHVLSQLLDKVKDDSDPKDGKRRMASRLRKPDGAKPQADPAPKTATKASLRVFTIVKAPDLDYNDDTRLAHYSGGATLERPNMTVKGQDIHAFLRNDSNDSSLDHATADGHVEVHETALRPHPRRLVGTCRILCGRRQSYSRRRAAAISGQYARNHSRSEIDLVFVRRQAVGERCAATAGEERAAP